MLATGEEITRVSGSFCVGTTRHATSRVCPPSEARIMVRLPRHLSRVAVACSLALSLASVLPAWGQDAGATAQPPASPAPAAPTTPPAPEQPAAAAPAPGAAAPAQNAPAQNAPAQNAPDKELQNAVANFW